MCLSGAVAGNFTVEGKKYLLRSDKLCFSLRIHLESSKHASVCLCFQEGCWFETIFPKSSAGFSKGEDDELNCEHSADDVITLPTSQFKRNDHNILTSFTWFLALSDMNNPV